MNELLGMLVPILMSGMGIGDILRKLGGSGFGAANLDGLYAMISTSEFSSKMTFPMVQNQDNVRSAAEVIAQRLGMNPYSGAGQGFVSALGGAYNMAPGILGSILGVPDGRQFFSTIANNASGISMASGFGRADVFNPYSIMAAQERTRNLSKVAYGLGINPDGGYDISYSHGLNMNEMGRVTQRILSSDVAYMDESGDRVDPNDADKFSKNLHDLGSKINEAVSMLSKITGSVDEAITVMDRLAGGNFLGGTQQQASDVANRAKRMASAVRVTSAMAGVSPTETFAHMQGLMTSMTMRGLGIQDQALAAGTSGLMGDLAYNAMMGFNVWAAANPNASPMERQRGMIAVQGRAQAYSSSKGAALAAAIADNSGMFSSEERGRMLDELRSGHTEYAARLARQRIGRSTYDSYMNDPGMQIAARHRAMQNDPEFMKDLDQASLEGNIDQAASAGARRMLRKSLADIDFRLSEISGSNTYGKDREDAVRKRFVELAKANGMKSDAADKTSYRDLRAFLQKRMDADEFSREEIMAESGAAINKIKSMTMSENDKSAAVERFRNAISPMVNDDTMKEIERRIGNGESLEDLIDEFASPKDRRTMLRSVLGGKITKEFADKQLKNPLRRIRESQNPNYTDKERMDAIANMVERAEVIRPGGLKGEMAKADFYGGAKSETEARSAFETAAKGDIRLNQKKIDFQGAYGKATSMILSDMFGDRIGNMEGKSLESFNARISKFIENEMKGGSSLKDAYKKAISDKGILTDADRSAIGKEGIEQLGKFADSGNLSRKSFYSFAASVLDETAGGASGAVAEMRELSRGKFGDRSQVDAFKRFIELAKNTGAIKMSDEEWKNLESSGLDKIDESKKGSGRAAIREALKKISPKGRRTDVNSTFNAMSVTGSADKAAQLRIAMEWRRQGGEISDLAKQGMIDDATVSMVQKLDDVNAQKMNAFSDAIKTGGTKFRDQAIEGVGSRMEQLGASLNKVGIDTIRKAFGGGEGSEDAKKQVEQALSSREQTKGEMGLVEALASGKIGGIDALEVMKNGKKGMEEAKKNAGNDYGEQMLAIARKAAQSGSRAYEIGSSIGGLMEFMSKFANGDALKVEVKGLHW